MCKWNRMTTKYSFRGGQVCESLISIIFRSHTFRNKTWPLLNRLYKINQDVSYFSATGFRIVILLAAFLLLLIGAAGAAALKT